MLYRVTSLLPILDDVCNCIHATAGSFFVEFFGFPPKMGDVRVGRWTDGFMHHVS